MKRMIWSVNQKAVKYEVLLKDSPYTCEDIEGARLNEDSQGHPSPRLLIKREKLSLGQGIYSEFYREFESCQR